MAVIKRIKGTQDILPQESGNWQQLEKTIHDIMALYNYKELRTPVFEKTDLFARGIGAFTDIVSKEMYTFSDRSKKSLTLKPEMTAPVIRAYLENNLQAKNPLNKLYYISSLFRQENPQAGRLRQFQQYGAESIGSNSALADIEIIDLAITVIENAGIKDFQIKINTVGDPQSRENYKDVLQKYLKQQIKNPSAETSQRIDQNPLRVLDSKDAHLSKIIKEAPQMIDFLSDYAANHYQEVKAGLKQLNVIFEEDPTLVRGLDYYTHTVFEITSGHLGAQNALCGGGRYDLLARQLGGPDVPAVGFAAGMERILMVLEKEASTSELSEKLDVYITVLGEKAIKSLPEWLKKLRSENFCVDSDFLARSMKAQMREANRQNARFVLMLGDDEIEKEKFTVKNMQTSEQQDISFSQIVDWLNINLKK